MSFLYNLYHDVHEDMNDSKGVKFYWDTLMSDVEEYADPKYCNLSIANHFYAIACGLDSASQMQGFKRGLALGLQLAAEAFHTPPLTNDEVKNDYMKTHFSKVELANESERVED